MKPLKMKTLILIWNFLFFSIFIISGSSFSGCTNKESQIKEEKDDENEKNPEEKTPYNLVIVLADDLTSDDLECYGGDNVSTPNINKLASQGMKFTNAYTSSAMCTPCRTSLYTGIYPVRNGAHKNGPEGIIKPGVESIAHHLNRVGYRVGLTGKEHINPLEQFNFEIVPGFTKKILGQEANYNVDELKPFLNYYSKQPFCLIIGSTLPHTPWTVGDRDQFNLNELKLHDNFYDTPETRERFRKYLAEVSALDHQVGDVMDLLKELELTDNTLFMFLGEQGSQFVGNKWTMWDQGIHSSIIGRLPNVIPEDSESDQLVQYVDIIPTFFDLIGEDTPDDLDGVSFADILRGESEEEVREYGYAMHSNSTEGNSYAIRAVFNKKYKLIWNLHHEKDYYNKYVINCRGYKSWVADKPDSETAAFLVDRYTDRPEFELYDIEKDPYELNNLAYKEEFETIRNNMKRKIDEWMIQQNDEGKSIDQ